MILCVIEKNMLEVFFKQHWYIFVFLCLEIQFSPVLSQDKMMEKKQSSDF